MSRPPVNESLVQLLVPIVNKIRAYHEHEVKGLAHFPTSGRTLLAVSHSLATYDIALLLGAIYQATGRLPRSVADHLFFKIPYLGDLVTAVGAIDGTCDNAKRLLADEELICVAPGGMREALRPSSQRYQILWEKRKGFARIALETGTPVVLAVCPKADDLYEVYPSRLTAWAYQKFKVPLFLARGIGLSPIPRPVKLIHFLSEPIQPPPPAADPAVFAQQLDDFHQRLIRRARELIGEAIAYRP